MKEIKVGGVPEHFNLPWHLCREEGDFEKEEIKLSWKDFPDGTGAMCRALREEEIDVAVILTEGVIKDILAGSQVKIIQEYIGSPLLWGIHVEAHSEYNDLKSLRGTKAAISRFGSGSHLMAYVNAQRLGWDPEDLEFEIVKDIDGAVIALQDERAGYFMWEHFTTKPLVDRGVFRRLGDCPTPWPCFVIAAREDFLKKDTGVVQKMLQVLNERTRDFKSTPGIEKQLSERYEQKEEDIREWLKITDWSQDQISAKEIDRVQQQLKDLNLIDQKSDNSFVVADLSKF